MMVADSINLVDKGHVAEMVADLELIKVPFANVSGRNVKKHRSRNKILSNFAKYNQPKQIS